MTNSSQSWETHPHLVGAMRYTHYQSLTSFLDSRKNPPVRNDGAVKTTGVEIWVKIWDFLLHVKMGRDRGNFYGFLWSSARATTNATKMTGVHLVDIDI